MPDRPMNAEESADFLAARPADDEERVRQGVASSPDGKPEPAPTLSRETLSALGKMLGGVVKRAIDIEIAKLAKRPVRLSPAYLKSLVDTIGGVIRQRLDQDAAGVSAELSAARREVASLKGDVEHLQAQIEQVRGVREIAEYGPDGRLISTARERYVG
jgi:hypothetical protein